MLNLPRANERNAAMQSLNCSDQGSKNQNWRVALDVESAGRGEASTGRWMSRAEEGRAEFKATWGKLIRTEAMKSVYMSKAHFCLMETNPKGDGQEQAVLRPNPSLEAVAIASITLFAGLGTG